MTTSLKIRGQRPRPRPNGAYIRKPGGAPSRGYLCPSTKIYPALARLRNPFIERIRSLCIFWGVGGGGKRERPTIIKYGSAKPHLGRSRWRSLNARLFDPASFAGLAWKDSFFRVFDTRIVRTVIWRKGGIDCRYFNLAGESNVASPILRYTIERKKECKGRNLSNCNTWGKKKSLVDAKPVTGIYRYKYSA